MMRGGFTGGLGMMGNPVMMRMIFALIDTDGDGTIELQEFQAAHERLFKLVSKTAARKEKGPREVDHWGLAAASTLDQKSNKDLMS
jgi:hypothetical protein